MIYFKNVCIKYGKSPIIQDMSFEEIPKGSVVALIGPNGAGKSTMFKSIAGIHPISSGNIYYKNQDISTLSNDKRAKDICYMPQNTYSNAALTVFEIVLLAKKFSSGKNKVRNDDIDEVSNLLQILNIEHLASSYISDLSGGQRQLVTLAQAIIRCPSVLLLDEPTSALDLNHQIESLDLIKKIVSNMSMVCFVALHDLSLAGRYADYIMVLEKGKLLYFGLPKEVMSMAMIQQVYKVQAEIYNSKHGVYILPYESMYGDKSKWNKISSYLK